jgi:predicted acetyltransferase
MKVELQRVSLEHKHVLRNLIELYLHDFSEYDGADVDEQGLFGYEYLDRYWLESERHPFLIRVNGKPAGFVLVRKIQAEPVTHSIAEFFVMRKYRRHGIGRQAASSIFDMFPGQWSVSQEAGNLPAQVFWRRVIAEYTHGTYSEEHLNTEEWHGPRQGFQSRMLEEQATRKV